MFRDAEQRGHVCYLLCRWIPGSPWSFTDHGYRPNLVMGTGLSTGQEAMILFAQALWRGDTLPVTPSRWDAKRFGTVVTLLQAMASGVDSVDEIDNWIAVREAEGR